VSVIVRRPGPPLDGLVRAITYRAGEQPRTSVEKILPGATTSLWINLNRDEFRSFGKGVRSAPGAMLAGPSSRATVIEFEQGHAHLSVTFVLGGASGFVAAPLTLACDEMVPLAFAWGSHGGHLREQVLLADSPAGMLQVLQDALIKQLVGPFTPDPAMVAAARALSGGVSVTGVADSLGLLPRTLRRRFTASVGLTPKRFSRVQRLQRVVRSLDGRAEVDWAAVAAGHGYADQPHLADEFRELADVTPSEYLRSRIDGPNHLRVP